MLLCAPSPRKNMFRAKSFICTHLFEVPLDDEVNSPVACSSVGRRFITEPKPPEHLAPSPKLASQVLSITLCSTPLCSPYWLSIRADQVHCW